MSLITSIINVHAEGSVARASIESMLASAEYAVARGVPVKTIIVADRATPDTIEAIAPYRDRTRIAHVDMGDLGPARNFGASLAESEYVSFADGDDLAGETWLYHAYVEATKDPKYIVHPHLYVHFGNNKEHISEIVPMTDPTFRKTQLIFANIFPAHHLSRKSTVIDVPYRKLEAGSGFGYEDWAWNRDTIRAGYVHVIAKDTIYFYRRRPGSLSAGSFAQHHLPMPSPRFFDDDSGRKRGR